MGKSIPNPVQEGLDSLAGGKDAAIGRIFGVTRQSIGMWRKYNSIPKHYTRAFCELTGTPVESLLRFYELQEGIHYDSFILKVSEAHQKEEAVIDKRRKRA